MEQAQVVAFFGPRSLADVLTNVPQLYFPGFWPGWLFAWRAVKYRRPERDWGRSLVH